MAMLGNATSEKEFGQAFLDDIINWVSMEMYPDDVFETIDLKDWIRDNLEPEGVFGYDALSEWARASGFVEVE